jgi:hypothetical protein
MQLRCFFKKLANPFSECRSSFEWKLSESQNALDSLKVSEEEPHLFDAYPKYVDMYIGHSSCTNEAHYMRYQRTGLSKLLVSCYIILLYLSNVSSTFCDINRREIASLLSACVSVDLPSRWQWHQTRAARLMAETDMCRSRSWPLGGDSFAICRRFHCQIFAAPAAPPAIV